VFLAFFLCSLSLRRLLSRVGQIVVGLQRVEGFKEHILIFLVTKIWDFCTKLPKNEVLPILVCTLVLDLRKHVWKAFQSSVETP
jgi:hypothetical protein